VTNDSNKPGDSGSTSRPTQLELPFGSASDHLEFFDILRQLEAGTLLPDRARARIMVLYQTSLGAWVRALAESHPEIASDVTQRLLRDVTQIAQGIATDAYSPSSRPTAGKTAHTTDERLKGKSIDVLRREALILQALLGTNATLALNELRELAAKVEPNIQPAAMTANLDRLVKDSVIGKPRKGHYASAAAGKAYLIALRSEIEARGCPSP
jgi:hypothetical protein